MADKPRSYPQQIQDLKGQLEEKDAINARLAEDNKRVIELAALVTDLQSQLAAKSTEDRQENVGSKAKWTDLEQRAVTAEQGVRDLHHHNKQLVAQITGLEQQLDIAGLERDKNLGKDAKIEQLHETLKTVNLRVTSCSQQLRDHSVESEATIAALSNDNRRLHAEVKSAHAILANVNDIVLGSDDLLSKLRQALGYN